MKTVGKVMFWLAIACLVGAIVTLSLLIGNLNGVLGIIGLSLVLAALIFLTIGVVMFLKDDDAHNIAESHDDAPKAH
jgi:uncharacterized membrane protein